MMKCLARMIHLRSLVLRGLAAVTPHEVKNILTATTKLSSLTAEFFGLQFTEFEPDTFSRLSSLENLELRSMIAVTSLPDGLLGNLVRLTKLGMYAFDSALTIGGAVLNGPGRAECLGVINDELLDRRARDAAIRPQTAVPDTP